MTISPVLPGEKHMTATVCIISTETPPRALLVHHKKYDRWMPPGGHVEFGENPYDAVIREALEESGVDVRPYLPTPKVMDEQCLAIPVPFMMQEQRIAPYGATPEHFHIDSVYVARVPYQHGTHQQEEAHDIGWFSKEDLATLSLFKNVRDVLVEILR